MKLSYLCIICGSLFSLQTFSQNQMDIDNKSPASKDARFYRPTVFQLETEGGFFSLGGYAEANSQYFVTEGETDGLHFQVRQFHVIAQSTMLDDRLHFIADIGYDAESQEFNLVEAAINLRFHKAFNLRGGVILPPLGYFNQNGDGPISDFIDWPLSSSTILPSRLSEMGMGLNGNIDAADTFEITYEMYAVNGLQNGVIDNDLPRTAIPLGKEGNLFGNDNNDKLSYTGRLGLHWKNFGEIGFSYYGGAYNSTEVNEVEVDRSRDLTILTADFQTNLQKLAVRGEITYANIDVFEGLGQLFGSEQLGYHIEASYPILNRIRLLGQDNNRLNLAFRIEGVDYNRGTFEETGTNIYDEILGFRTGMSLRLGKTSVLKLNYSYFDQKDILGNSTKTGGFQFGFATNF